ncbi:MAG: carbohydrate kinase family protein [Lachnospiraceae bacterium]|nr:carbohydrate kinase family protein [Lachnospiraceae bacterium]
MGNAYDLICIGTALVDSIIKGFDPNPISASGYRALSGSIHVGGEAVNEAMAAAKLGVKTGIFCCLGSDEAGEMIENALKRTGVDTGLILRVPDHSTPVTTMFVKEDGSRKSITNEAHRFNFRPDLYPERVAGSKALIFGSLFRAPFDDPGIIHAVLKTAHENGEIVFADTKLPNFRFLTLEDLMDSLPLIDYITPNEDEARYYTKKETPEEMADVFLSYGIKNVIIKLGAKGCFFKNGKESIFLPPYPIHAVDATGAGDNFAAGFASEILRGSSDQAALRFANACGAICTTAVGASAALQGREQVLEFMKKNSTASDL